MWVAGWLCLSFATFVTAIASEEPELGSDRVVFQTNYGDIEFGFYPSVAPRAVEHIYKLVRLGCYNTNHFFRVEKGFVAQVADVVGVRTAPMNEEQRKEASKTVIGELSPVKHVRGMLSMGRYSDPDSVSSSFSILLGDAPHLDGQYAIFGKVTKGDDTLVKLEQLPTRREGIFVMPTERITIHSSYCYVHHVNQKKRNFQIEAFKHRVVVDPKYADKTWNTLEHAIHEIYNHNTSGLSFEELYRNAYNMVLHSFGEKLYSGLVSTMTSHLKEISKSIEAAQGDSFLEQLNRKWNDHNKALQLIGDIFMYMDRTYIPSTKKTPVHALGLNLWRDNIIRSSKIQTRLLNTLLELVLRERTGEVIDRGLMRNIIKMLMDLGSLVYQEDFEKPFLEVSAEFYKVESQRFIECCDCGEYLKKAEKRLNEEIERVTHYLDTKSEVKITNVVEKEMIDNHMLRLVHMENSGLVNMLLDDKYEDLGRMYNLFRRVHNGLQTIREVMISHLSETGKQLVTDPDSSKDPVEFVQRLLDERDKYDSIISLAFSNDKTFQNALNSSFEYFINLNARSPEFISLFVDDKLQKGLKGVNEEDVEIILDKVMMLFRHLQEKDVFEKYYKQHLAKRLLSGKTVSDDAERSLIVKLKTECGYQFTSELEGMFAGMKTLQDTIQGFYASHPELGDGPTLVVQVLTTGSWPSVNCNFPAEMSTLCEKFRLYYLGTHTGRRLSWQINMGTADIKATFGKGQKHELNVSTYQMCVLMLFNNAERLSYEEIEQATAIPVSDLKRCLACVKGKNVVRKEPMSKDIGEEDAFFAKDKFTSKFYKVKIGTVVAQEESEPEKQQQ